jgi:hypothetical protein
MTEATVADKAVTLAELDAARLRIETLAEALLEHITRFDDRVAAIMDEFETNINAVVDDRVQSRVDEILAKRLDGAV